MPWVLDRRAEVTAVSCGLAQLAGRRQHPHWGRPLPEWMLSEEAEGDSALGVQDRR